ncbi:hypothetical protein [Flavobacterium sp. LAR06]|uniref:hypothetical protein n=1 Tax=Flavobacterium sp. LAR06 TaxID=3064897 RepID=UPI0035BF6C80
MKRKLAELAVVIVTQHGTFKKLQTKKSNIEISNKNHQQAGFTYTTYKDLAEIETKKTHTNGIHQMIVWNN